MSAAAVIAALATMHRELGERSPDEFMYGVDGKYSRMATVDSMRCVLRDSGVDEFAAHTQARLAGSQGDMIVSILEDLYDSLDTEGEHWTWDDFEAFMNAED